MPYKMVIKRAWEMVWRCRTLWVFGALLALTTTNGLFFIWNEKWVDGHYRDYAGIQITLPNDSVVRLPGDGLSIDLSDPDGAKVYVDGQEWQRFKWQISRDWQELWKAGNLWIPSGLWALLWTTVAMLAAVLVAGAVLRYVAEGALIRMVDRVEETGEKLRFRQGLRLGFSRTAWRLFAIDVAVNVPVILALILICGLALSPLLLWLTGSLAAGATGTALAVAFLLLFGAAAFAVNAVLSLVMQVIRRACAIENLGVAASIRRGFSVARRNFKEVSTVWLIWLGMRLVWMGGAVVALVVLSPVLLGTTLIAALASAVPVGVVGAALTPFLQGPFPWIAGGIVALPIFIVILASPLLFVGGLVEILKSSTWTLAYRELQSREALAPSPARKQDAAGLEATAVAS